MKTASTNKNLIKLSKRDFRSLADSMRNKFTPNEPLEKALESAKLVKRK